MDLEKEQSIKSVPLTKALHSKAKNVVKNIFNNRFFTTIYSTFFLHTIENFSFFIHVYKRSVMCCSEKSLLELIYMPEFATITLIYLTAISIFFVGFSYQVFTSIIISTLCLNNITCIIGGIYRMILNEDRSFENSINGGYSYLAHMLNTKEISNDDSDIFLSTVKNIRTAVKVYDDKDERITEEKIKDKLFEIRKLESLVIDAPEYGHIYKVDTIEFVNKKLDDEFIKSVDSFLISLIIILFFNGFIAIKGIIFHSLLCITILLNILYCYYEILITKSFKFVGCSSLVTLIFLFFSFLIKDVVFLLVSSFISSLYLYYISLITLNCGDKAIIEWHRYLNTKKITDSESNLMQHYETSLLLLLSWTLSIIFNIFVSFICFL